MIPSACIGTNFNNAVKLAVKEINDAGGVMVEKYGAKIPLELKLLDDESDPTKTVQRLESHYSDGVLAYRYLGGVGRLRGELRFAVVALTHERVAAPARVATPGDVAPSCTLGKHQELLGITPISWNAVRQNQSKP